MNDFEKAVGKLLASVFSDSNSPIVIAFSGGSDSTALLLAVCEVVGEQRSRIWVAHFNHQLRSDASAEVDHVAQICKRLNLKLEQGSGDVAAYATEHKLSLETTARKLRYEFLEQVAERHGINCILTGHTLDDQVETVLMNIMRGSGIVGVAGMDKISSLCINQRELKIVRPLLELRHSDCEAYCRLAKVPFLSDPSNLNLEFKRNKIRHQTLPNLEQTTPGAFNAIERLSINAKQIRDYLKDDLDSRQLIPAVCQHGVITLDRTKFNALPDALKPLLLLQMWHLAGQKGVLLSQWHIANVVQHSLTDSGKLIELSNGVRVQFEYDLLLLLPPTVVEPPCYQIQAPRKPTRIVLGGAVTVGAECAITAQTVSNTANFEPDKFSVLIDSDRLKGDLFVRSRRAGDKFTPLGKTSAVKLKEFLIKAHVPSYLRNCMPLVTSGEHIIWVVGYRISDEVKITARTNNALQIKVSRDFLKGCVPVQNHQPM